MQSRELWNLDSVQLICDITFGGGKQFASTVVPPTSSCYEGWRENCEPESCSLSIPDLVSSIDDFSFIGCTGLKTIWITDSIQSTVKGASLHCKRLSTVFIPINIRQIGGGTLEEYLHLTILIQQCLGFNRPAFSLCQNKRVPTPGESISSVFWWLLQLILNDLSNKALHF